VSAATPTHSAAVVSEVHCAVACAGNTLPPEFRANIFHAADPTRHARSNLVFIGWHKKKIERRKRCSKCLHAGLDDPASQLFELGNDGIYPSKETLRGWKPPKKKQLGKKV
jgi:hypothetical protein